MATQPGVQEILAKIRERVQARAPRPVPAGIGGAVSGTAVEPRRGYDTTELRINLHDCNLLHNAVGALNPRKPGLLNQAIQFIKRLMKRSLTWYTRPLHQFHAAVTRTLNEMTKVQDSLDAAVRRMEADLQKRDAQTAEFCRATEQRIAELQTIMEDMRRQSDRVRQEAWQPQKGIAADAAPVASTRTVIANGENVLEIKTPASSRSPVTEQQH